jgi:ribosomal-protein-alanine N-acetyltransferase
VTGMATGGGEATGELPDAAHVTLRRMVEGDVSSVARLERDTFSSPWRHETFLRVMTGEGTEIWVADLEGEGVVGYAVIWCVLDHGELANLAVHPGHRNRGLGSLLLDRVIERAGAKGVRNLYLEVRASNGRAADLYERRGFREIGWRRNYYDRPKEDARVLAMRLR